MFQIKSIFFALIAVVSALSVQAQGQAQAQPQTEQFFSCQNATAKTNVTASKLMGVWYEKVRAPGAELACVLTNVSRTANGTEFQLDTKYAPSKSGLLRKKADHGIIAATEFNNNPTFNVTYGNRNVTYKILDTDGDSFLVICGFTNASDDKTAFGAILTRNQFEKQALVMEITANASKSFTGFNDTTTAEIFQSKQCHNSGATNAPMLVILFVSLYVLLKLVKF